MNDKVIELAEKIQNDCHGSVESIMRQTYNINYQDATNVFLFRQLAELTVYVRELREELDSKNFIINGLNK